MGTKRSTATRKGGKLPNDVYSVYNITLNSNQKIYLHIHNFTSIQVKLVSDKKAILLNVIVYILGTSSKVKGTA